MQVKFRPADNGVVCHPLFGRVPNIDEHDSPPDWTSQATVSGGVHLIFVESRIEKQEAYKFVVSTCEVFKKHTVSIVPTRARGQALINLLASTKTGKIDMIEGDRIPQAIQEILQRDLAGKQLY